MRILPPPFEGLHPAFPPPKSSTPAPSSTAIHPLPGAVGLIILGVGKAISSVGLRAFAFEASAYALLGIGALTAFRRDPKDEQIGLFLGSYGIEVPQRKLIDRVGNFDADDALILGGMAGVYAAARARRPWSIYGWKRWLGATLMGTTVVGYGIFGLSAAVQLRGSAAAAYLKSQKEQLGWQVAVGKTVLAFAEQRMRANGISVPTIAVPDTVDRTSNSTGRAKIGYDLSSWPNGSNEPHLTVMQDGELEPVPCANTNYTWSVSTEHAVPELEAHIMKLRQRRQMFARDAELLWHWLASKEAEFYNTSKSDASADSDTILAARRYVEILGSVHAKVWKEASMCDWMVADARKRIQQIQPLRGNAEPKSVQADGLQASPSQMLSTAALSFLESASKGIEARRKALVHERSQLELALTHNPQVQAQTRKVVYAGTQIPVMRHAQHRVQQLNEDIDTANFDAEIVGRVIADCQRLSSDD